MKEKLILIGVTGLVFVGLFLFANYWTNTQPIWVVDEKIDDKFLSKIPNKNRQIIHFIETNGKGLAPSYDKSVCTEFVIKVIDNFGPLTNSEKNNIRIITQSKIGDLIKDNSPIIKGVQTALIQGNKGIEIDKLADVNPGDFVQFWNVYNGKEYGHCGIVMNIRPNESLILYSSHPLTNGYGKQKFLWPDKLFFVRLK
jgi:hypothetical protein